MFKEKKDDTPIDQFELSFGGGDQGQGSNGPQRGPNTPTPVKEGNIRAGFHVVPTLAEFYPHPNGTRVELVGCIRDLIVRLPSQRGTGARPSHASRPVRS